MKNTFYLNIISPETEIFSNKIEFVILPGEEGELGIYPYHTRLITRIKTGTIRIKLPNKIVHELIFITSGILEVAPQKVIVLANTAIHGHDLNEIKIQETKKTAEEVLANHNSKIEYVTAQATLAIAIAQLATIQKLRHKI